MPRWVVTAADFRIDVDKGSGAVSHALGSHAILCALGTAYNLNLSARMFPYGTVAYVNNGRNGGTFLVFATPRAAGSCTSPMAGELQTGVYIGMMHVF
ncbi:hypothetical protein [Caballeronia ptereochthonis]|nr:hypothetical protein [Caballeronia ptereochthonis]